MPKKFKGFDYEDGRIVKEAYFNGYNFGDRLLEGVIFKATIQNDGTMKVEVTPASADYLRGLNAKKWLKEALEYAQGNDLFSEKPDGSGEDLQLLEAE